MITVRFSTAITEIRKDIFLRAAERWDEVITTSFPSTEVDNETLDGLLIEASIEPIDGEQGVLGQAGPTILLNGTELPAKGIMQFDTADVERLERESAFADVVIHEMGHVIGFGTLWSRFNLVEASGTNNPQFVGSSAMQEYSELLNVDDPRSIPIANTGGAGTREGHWRELVFGDELMTGFLSGENRPLSRLTLAALEDMGYSVNFDAADDFVLPSFRELAEKGITEAVRICDLCRMGRPEPVLLP